MEFPIFNSKALSDGKSYNLTDPSERRKYFESKLGSKISDLKEYLEANSFVGYMLARKMAGKGTYAKMVEEILGPDRVTSISVGDIVRNYHSLFENEENSKKAMTELAKYYRGFISLEDAVAALWARKQESVSVPTELILAMLKLEIAKVGRKALFIDGLPRTADQVSYSLFFRDLINYRDDPDFFVLIDVAKEMIDARMRYRAVCPICHTSKNTMFNPSKFVKHDDTTGNYYLLCDNASCAGYEKTRLVGKEGDTAGIDSIKQRIDQDTQLMSAAFDLHGVPKILISSAIKLDDAEQILEDYEIQPKIAFYKEDGTIKQRNEKWVFKNDQGDVCCTMLSATYVVNLLTQLHAILIYNR